MNPLDKDIDDILKYDALAEAERLTGQSYKDNDAVSTLGLLLRIKGDEDIKSVLDFINDVHFSIPLDQYIARVQKMGFEQIFYNQFSAEHCGKVRDCEQFVFWNPMGILLHFDTYFGKSVNSGNCYFNLKLKEGASFFGLGCSGGLSRKDKSIFVGGFDCREGVKHRITMCQDAGEFLPQWTERPFLWLINWSESQGKTYGYDYDSIAEAIVRQLPEHVRKAISP